MPRSSNTVAWLFLASGLVALSLSWTRAFGTRFPVPEQGYRQEFIDFQAPQFPDAPPIVVGEIKLVEEGLPVQLDPWLVPSDQPIVVEGEVVMPEWVIGKGNCVVWLLARYFNERGEFNSLTNYETFQVGQDGRAPFRLESAQRLPVGKYRVQLFAVHFGYQDVTLDPNWPPAPDDIETLNRVIVREAIAEGVLIISLPEPS